ncbi:alpha/beta fold hydrolase [Chryseolinea lacunae]|uniref:Prolyl oligopeptidase family serine peptidase n=1 Tax=Chryseolinea lacunae TaxID=2801331 RepID=A0ABS1L1S9_9BACT|nr:prolyl oligopeptidase family serine peptidase [Chryseolinea lacunae]MBL0745645.1 prolyl oligopeptidase family serine peptidase [Chryseolinea lacunae]
MKRLVLLNLAFILYVAGLLCAIVVGYGTGAIVVLAASAVILCLYGFTLYRAFKTGRLLTWDVLAYSLGVLVVGEIFLQGYSIAIARSVFSLPGFYQLHTVSGFILLGLFVYGTVVYAQKSEDEGSLNFILTVIGLSGFISFIGFLGFARVLPNTVRLIYHSFVFLIFLYLGYFLWLRLKRNRSNSAEQKAGLVLSVLMLMFWIVRWQTPELIPPGIYRIVVNIGFVAVIVLPVAILFFRKMHFLTVFILYAIVSDLYFISFDRDFRYLVNTGASGCVGFENATQYPIVNDPGVPTEELFKTPAPEEVEDVRDEWRTKDFSPRQVRVEYVERQLNGDSIKVISHVVDGKKHYGMIRIPLGLRLDEAPILLVLHGGGAETDVLETEFLYRIAGGTCEDEMNRYLIVAPSFRGDIARGKEFCFRSEGYTGDVWQGAAEDAVSFLEAVKTMYHKREDEKILAVGVSRGATVALLVGGLTDKLDHIIAISTHTDFVNADVLKNERVGSDYPKIFYTPKTPPASIRKKMIASSPYYFAEHLPYVEVHQGRNDVLTTAWHAEHLRQRLKDIGRPDTTFKIQLYDGKGHGYADDNLICKSLHDFAERAIQ